MYRLEQADYTDLARSAVEGNNISNPEKRVGEKKAEKGGVLRYLHGKQDVQYILGKALPGRKKVPLDAVDPNKKGKRWEPIMIRVQ